MTHYYETTIRYSRADENGITKKVSEKYLVDAVSFTEAEARTAEYASRFSDDFVITHEKTTRYSSIIKNDDADYYSIKVVFHNIDERTGKVKNLSENVLCGAASPQQAFEEVEKMMQGTVVDYSIGSISLTNIKDIIEYEKEGV